MESTTSFILVKWYLDLITDDGVALIFYAARMRWGPLRLSYASVLHAVPGEEARERRTIRRGAWPELRGDRLEWEQAPLGIRGRWIRDAPGVQRTLARGASGSIRWTCHQPRARACVQWGGARFEGLGYAECLRLTISPSHLPFRTLRWGRHTSERHSLVWIDWTGETRRTWVWLDGAEAGGAVVSDDGVVGLPGGVALALHGSRDIRDRRVPFTMMHEHKLLSRSAIVGAAGQHDQGWAVHEVVTR